MTSKRIRERQKPGSLSQLPVELARRVANYLPAINISNPTILRAWLKEYPLEYLAVDINDCDGFDNLDDVEGLKEFGKIFDDAPSKLQEVTFSEQCFRYKDARPVLDKLLKMNLDFCCILTPILTRRDLRHFVRSCCESNNRRHYIALWVESPDEAPGTSAPQVAKLLREDKALVWFHLLSSACIRTEPRPSMLSRLQELPLKLQHLKLQGTNFGLHDATLIARALGANCRLVTLEIESSGLANTELELIGKGIANNTVLVHFHAKSSRGAGIGIKQLVKAITPNETLESLSVEDVDLGENGGITFADLLKDNQTLRGLSLSGCRLGADGCRIIVDAIKKNKSLERIRIDRCGMNGDDRRRLHKMKRKLWGVGMGDGYHYYPLLPRKVLLQNVMCDPAFLYREHEWWYSGDLVRDGIHELARSQEPPKPEDI